MTLRFLVSRRRAPRRRDPEKLIRTFWRTLERFAHAARLDREPSGSRHSHE